MSNMVVRTNIFAQQAHRNMKNVGLDQRRAANRLSSGYRINSAADDAAGLAISETMRSQIRGLDQASRNAQDAQAMMLTAEGGLEEISNAAQRVRELLVQASNDTNTNDQREMINQEIMQMAREIASAQHRVEFNSNRVLAMGSPIDVEVSRSIGMLEIDNTRVSALFGIIDHNKSQVNTAMDMMRDIPSHALFDDLGVRQRTIIEEALAVLNLNAAGITDFLAPQAAPGDITGTTLITGGHAVGSDGVPTPIPASGATPLGTSVTSPAPFPAGTTAGGIMQYLTERMDTLDTANSLLNNVRAVMSNNSRFVFEGVDEFRDETSSGNFRAFFQAGANASQGVVFDFEALSRAVSAAAATIDTVTALVANPDSGSGIGRGVEVTHLIAELNVIVEEIAEVRAGLGAVQNRLDHTMRSLDISSENLQDSESRVRNADMAREMMAFTMTNVLQQSAISMLSHANQIPNNLLQVLQG